jgi:nitrate/TMAO reductase-like tetraheme cytochrome c subunit
MRRVLGWIWRERWRRWTAIGLALLLVASVGGVEATSQSQFCGSCHIMDPYYSTWKHSTHKDVACVECHVAPGAQNLVAA